MNEIVFDYRKLEGKIIELYGTRGNFANTLDVNGTVFCQKLKKGLFFNNKQILEICNLLDIKKDEIGKYFFTLKVKKI